MMKRKPTALCLLAALIPAASASAQIGPPAPGGESLFYGGVPSGKATLEIMLLPLQEAIDRGLKYNLGVLLGEQDARAARARKFQALAALLTNVSATVSEGERP